MTIIIGGGVFGLAIGWQLAQAGQPVTILEQGQVGRGATWAAAGMLMPWKLSRAFSQELFQLQQASHQMWPNFAQTITAGSPAEIDYQTGGRYFLALMDKAVNRLQRQFDFHRQLGFPLEWLAGEALHRRLPVLGPSVLAGIFTPMAHWVDNRRLVTTLRQAFLEAGGCLREETPVKALLVDHGQNRVQGVRLSTAAERGEETLPAETVVMAAGAWSSRLAGLPPALGSMVGPRKGQSLILQMPPAQAQPLIQQPLLGPVYLVPRSNGHLIVGTTVERNAGFDTRSTAGGLFHMLRKARAMVPAIDALPIVEMGAGLRPTGPDRLPVLGRTGTKGLIVATGGHSYGILLSPIVAQTIALLILTGETDPLIRPFTPGDAETQKSIGS